MCGILDNDYMASFDDMVLLLTWVFRVLKAKGLNQKVIDRLKSIIKSSTTSMGGATSTSVGL